MLASAYGFMLRFPVFFRSLQLTLLSQFVSFFIMAEYILVAFIGNSTARKKETYAPSHFSNSLVLKIN